MIPGDPGLESTGPLASLDDGALEGFELIIDADGSVTFIDFPPELLELAIALNPDDPLVCARRTLFEASRDDAGRPVAPGINADRISNNG